MTIQYIPTGSSTDVSACRMRWYSRFGSTDNVDGSIQTHRLAGMGSSKSLSSPSTRRMVKVIFPEVDHPVASFTSSAPERPAECTPNPTHTAVAFGVLACQLGKKVRFYTATGLANELLEAQDQHALGKRLTQLARMDLLIVDEVGFVPFTPEGARLLFQAFSERYLKGSLLITSNLEFSHWLEVFGDERLTGALLDRLTHHCHVLEFNGDSYRFKESLREREGVR